MKTHTLSEIKAIVSRLARQYGAERIYLFGALPAEGGEILVNDKAIHGHSVKFLKNGVGMLPADRCIVFYEGHIAKVFHSIPRSTSTT